MTTHTAVRGRGGDAGGGGGGEDWGGGGEGVRENAEQVVLKRQATLPERREALRFNNVRLFFRTKCHCY